MDASRSLALTLLVTCTLIAPLARGGGSLDCASNCLAKLSRMEAAYPAHGPIRLITENASSHIFYVNVGLEYQADNAWSEAIAAVNAPPGRKGMILALVRAGTQFRITLDPDQPTPSSDWKTHLLRFRVDVFIDGRLTEKVYSTPFRVSP